MSLRLRMALDSGGLILPAEGEIAVLHPRSGMDLSPLPQDRLRITQPMKPDFDHFTALGYDCAATTGTRVATTLLCLPRAKALAQNMVAEACLLTDGLIIVDGARTDGIDSLLKACRARVEIAGSVAKAHGRAFWFTSDPETFADWRIAPSRIADGFVTAPGVFSADAVDPASQGLIAALPDLRGHVVDLGAGWGYLSSQIAAMPAIERIDLVEADHVALHCARQNVPPDKAHFHWADATLWRPDSLADVVVMNPPFHVGRKADPDLGRAFIAASARALKSSGDLWMVANRHLPYESALAAAFSKVEERTGDSRFKVLHAQRPISAQQSRAKPHRTRR